MAHKDAQIGFIGGCLTHQPGIAFPDLFHRRIARSFEANHKIWLHWNMSSDWYAEPSRRADDLLANGVNDVLLLHRSSTTFYRKAMLVFLEQQRMVLHPFWLRRGPSCLNWLQHEQNHFARCFSLKAWPRSPHVILDQAANPETHENLAQRQQAWPRHTFKRRFKALQDLSWMAAEWCGLLDWAIRDELRIVAEVHQRCCNAGRSLVILGPGMNHRYGWISRFNRELDRRLQSWADCHKACYVSLFSGGHADSSVRVKADHYFSHDPWHFNSEGHAFLAARLEPDLIRLLG